MARPGDAPAGHSHGGRRSFPRWPGWAGGVALRPRCAICLQASEPLQGDTEDTPMPWPPPSTLPDTPFPSRTLAAVAAVAEALLSPGYWALDRLLALLVPTTAQRARWRRHRAGRCLAVGARVLLAPALALALALALPPALLGLLLWLPAQAKRRPFVHQRTAGTAAAEPWDPRRARGFTFLTANVCLLPSGLARFSNLGDTRRRAALIGRVLAAGAPAEAAGHRRGLLEPWRGRGYGGTAARGHPGGDARGDAWRAAGPAETVDGTMEWSEMAVGNPTPMGNPMSMGNPTPTNPTPMTNPSLGAAPCPMSSPGPERPIPLADPMPPVLSARIPPDVDFVCLQEVFDGAAAAVLRRQLGRRFPHVLWGVGPGGLRCGRLRALGSGLLLGSRFPPLAARFLPFPNAAREDALANKGLLVAQVLLGMGRGRRVVGYLGCTHLQAPAADATIRDQQLSWVLQWLREFRDEQHRPGDLVAFDVLCGDLNFDNCSRGDSQNRRHALFKEFWDPACRDSGQEQPWAIGTLLNYLRIYEEPVSTPEEMKRTLSEPWGRERFLAGPILSCGTLDPMAARPWQGRRVDRALLRRGPTLTTEVTGYSVITELATMSDHLPVALRLRLGPADL
ncbi:sphingomyelin phosphodiesterase 5-like [Ammospiza nelsoni]|uniref:sphingomyelin phosphodiesterase 5-like n=1 Tax=Ammospiza nelsoni TaxID=2857394 RepID=UPI002869A6AA|nr:sphingomyelin phosphodiesterase 5-like [Ammospiza nelsoni]